MRQITLRYPELRELAGRSHTDLPGLLGRISRPDEAAALEAEDLCRDWVSGEFGQLLNSLQLEGRLSLLDSNVDATSHDKRVMTYKVSDGFSVEGARETIKAAWDVTLNAAAEAFYIRIKEIVDGRPRRQWAPHQVVGHPTL